MKNASSTPSLEMVSIEDLKPYEKNARTHSPEQIDQISKSIAEFGFINPVLVREDYSLLAGHGRVEAAKKLGLSKIPVLFVGHLTPEQARAYILADNKIALNAGWDYELLSQELEALQDFDFDLSLTGFSEQEIDKLLEQNLDIDDGYENEEEKEEYDPADTKGVIGPYRFDISREDFKEWEEGLRASVGFKKSDIIAEIKRRLDI